MPADVTVSALHLNQALPLMKPFLLDLDPGVTIPNAGANTFQIGTFTMPFYGDMVYQGSIRIMINVAGVQQPNPIRISALSTPAPTAAPEAMWRTEGGADVAIRQVPLVASWANVAQGTAVSVMCYVANGSGGQTITILRASGVMFCTKT